MGYDIIGNTGSSGPSVPLTGGHVEDGDTIHHWLLDGTAAGMTDTVGSLNLSYTGGVAGGPGPYAGSGSVKSVTNNTTGLRTSAHSNDIDPGYSLPLTYAFLSYQDSVGSLVGSRDLLRMEPVSPGTPSFRFDFTNTNQLWIGRNTPAWESYLLAIDVPVDTWVWMALVFKADGDVVVRVNDTETTVGFTGGYSPNASTVLGIGQTWNLVSHVRIYDLIIKNIEATSEQLTAMQAECPLL